MYSYYIHYACISHVFNYAKQLPSASLKVKICTRFEPPRAGPYVQSLHTLRQRRRGAYLQFAGVSRHGVVAQVDEEGQHGVSGRAAHLGAPVLQRGVQVRHTRRQVLLGQTARHCRPSQTVTADTGGRHEYHGYIPQQYVDCRL